MTSAAGTGELTGDGAGSVVVVGSAARDVAADDSRGWRLGGAVSYVGLTLARLGLRPKVLLGADSAAAGAIELELLRSAGAELRVIPLAASPVFDNREVDGVRVQRCLEPGDPLPSEVVPAEWAEASTWILAPVAGELASPWATVPPAGAFVALGGQGLLRGLSRNAPVRRVMPRSSPLLDRADLVVVSAHDLGPGASISDLGPLLRRPGAKLVITDGAAGGTEWRVAGGRAVAVRRYDAIAAAEVADATGAGDVFLAGLMASRLGHPLVPGGPADADLRLAAALGSLAVEAPGLGGVPDAAAVADRLRPWIRRS